MWSAIVPLAVAGALAAGGIPEPPPARVVGIENATLTLPTGGKVKIEPGMAGDRPTVRVTFGGAVLEADRFTVKQSGYVTVYKAGKGKDGSSKYTSVRDLDPDSPMSFVPRPVPAAPGWATPPIPIPILPENK